MAYLASGVEGELVACASAGHHDIHGAHSGAHACTHARAEGRSRRICIDGCMHGWMDGWAGLPCMPTNQLPLQRSLRGLLIGLAT